jgi:AraC-like DNA-binding protein
VAERSRVPDPELSTTESDMPPADNDGNAPDPTGDKDVTDAIDRLLRVRQLFRDPNLTLERIARRAGIPARQISGAINRVHGRNVSQFVNEYRVAEAARRLVETEDSITTVMLESGFQTKSNFNREFLRVTGMSPSAYRRSGPSGTAVTPTEETSRGSS